MGVIEKKQEKRIKILDEACKLFIEKGVQSTAIDEVVKMAGIAKGTFYLYFNDKRDLVDQIILYKSIELVKDAGRNLLQKRRDTTMTLADQAVYFTACMIDYMKRNKEILILINKNLSLSLRDMLAVNDREIDDAMREWSVHLKNAKGYDFADSMKLLHILVDMVVAVCCDAIIYERPYPIEEMKPVLFQSIRSLLA